jgi:hypothetical protein
MSKYLIQTTEIYRVDTEVEAITMIQEAGDSRDFFLKKGMKEYKERKQKGEVVDAYWKVTLTKNFTDEKEPITQTTVTYDVNGGSAF